MRAALLRFIVAASAVATSWQVGAQCRLCTTPTTKVEQGVASDDLQISVETNLNFDRLILSGAEGGAIIKPDGSKMAIGGISDVSSRAVVATVVVHGQPGRGVTVDIPRRIELFSLSGGRLSFDQVETDLPSSPRLDSGGKLTFRFGGRLTVTGDSDGTFRGDLPVTVEYAETGFGSDQSLSRR